MTPRRRVLLLCTGNSARSQMAEGLVNHYMADRWEARSAGTKPTGYVHPLAVQVMVELGIDISSQVSKPVGAFRNSSFDLVITVCDNAARTCPLWLGSGRIEYIGFPDPAAATGSVEERLDLFRQVRDAIRQQIVQALQKVLESLEHFT